MSNLRIPRALITSITAIAALAGTEAAHAETRLGVYGIIGLAGEAEAELETDNASPNDTEDLDYSLGAGLSYDAALARILSLGVLFRFYGWGADNYDWETDGDNEGLGLDVAFLPRLRFPARKLELYLSAPIGLTVASKDDNTTFVIVETEYDMGVGYNYGLFGGIQVPIDRDMALFGELGYQARHVSQSGHAEADEDTDAELTYDTGQFVINLGAAFF